MKKTENPKKYSRPERFALTGGFLFALYLVYLLIRFSFGAGDWLVERAYHSVVDPAVEQALGLERSKLQDIQNGLTTFKCKPSSHPAQIGGFQSAELVTDCEPLSPEELKANIRNLSVKLQKEIDKLPCITLGCLVGKIQTN